MMQELALRMPWCYALDEKERHILLALIQKMLAAGPDHADGGEPVGAAAAATSGSMKRGGRVITALTARDM
jgi:hypothetical protein